MATLNDLASQRLLGWSMGEPADTQLMIDALEHAAAVRGVCRMDGVMFNREPAVVALDHLVSALDRVGRTTPACSS